MNKTNQHNWEDDGTDYMGDADYKCSKCGKIASQWVLIFDEECPGPKQTYIEYWKNK